MVFTYVEREFLSQARLGRVATVSKDGEPDVAPVGFGLDDDDNVLIGGLDNTKTRKYHNVKATGRASFVVDDLQSVDPWRPRGVKVTGAASIVERNGRPVLRIVPETVWSWALNQDAEKRFAGIEKRSVA